MEYKNDSLRKSGKKFSIVIAIAPDRNPEVIDSIKNIDYDKSKCEVIVVRGKNPSKNRNRGARKSCGEIIAFFDDDAVLDKSILKKAEEFFNLHEKIDVIGGPQLTPKDEKGFAKISGYALSSKFGCWKISNRYAGSKLILNADETHLTSANMFCRRHVFNKICFNPLLYPGEDPDFIARAIKSNFKIAYSPELIVHHRRRGSLFEFAKQNFLYGKTRPVKEPLKETLKKPFFLVPSIFIMYLLFIVIYSIFNIELTGSVIGFAEENSVNLVNVILLLPLIAYIGLNLLVSIITAIEKRDALALVYLPFIFLTIHLSYGAGFLYAYLKGSKKQQESI